MPPRTEEEYRDTSFTGVPADMITAAKDIAEQRSREKGKTVFVRDVFSKAIEDLKSRLDKGEQISWPGTRPNTGKKPYHVRLEIGLLEDMRDTCKKYNVRKNIFFLVALRDYLKEHGQEFSV